VVEEEEEDDNADYADDDCHDTSFPILLVGEVVFDSLIQLVISSVSHVEVVVGIVLVFEISDETIFASTSSSS